MELTAQIERNDKYSTRVKITIRGLQPASKGSYRAVNRRSKRHPDKTVSVLVPMDKREKPWRKAICEAVAELHVIPQMTRDYTVSTLEHYYLLRPKTVKVSKRSDPNVKPDIDKLIRATHDGLTDSGLIIDDSIICATAATKQYVTTPGECGLKMYVEAHPNCRKASQERNSND